MYLYILPHKKCLHLSGQSLNFLFCFTWIHSNHCQFLPRLSQFTQLHLQFHPLLRDNHITIIPPTTTWIVYPSSFYHHSLSIVLISYPEVFSIQSSFHHPVINHDFFPCQSSPYINNQSEYECFEWFGWISEYLSSSSITERVSFIFPKPPHFFAYFFSLIYLSACLLNTNSNASASMDL